MTICWGKLLSVSEGSYCQIEVRAGRMVSEFGGSESRDCVLVIQRRRDGRHQLPKPFVLALMPSEVDAVASGLAEWQALGRGGRLSSLFADASHDEKGVCKPERQSCEANHA